MYKVLLVDDETQLLASRSRIIKDLGFSCLTAQNGKDAINILNQEHPDIVLTDIKMPNLDGFDVLEATKELDPSIPVIFFTGYGSIESAVEAMSRGAYYYIQKPVSPEIIEMVLKRALEHIILKQENSNKKSKTGSTIPLKNMIGNSKSIQDIVKRIRKVAQTDANVFIYGESGTGKEVTAQNIHLLSARAKNPFIPLDCAALPPTLIESEIFGYEKGAFTGATKTKPGILELADGGTVFLDEIVDLDYNLQSKLLRVIQERKFRRIGGTETIDVNIRIVSASNILPEKAVEQNKLRQDLYYRLNVVPIFLPPLRDRKEDIPLLVYHFIKQFNPSIPRTIRGISRDAMRCLRNYDWPGNVRELQNCIEQAMSLTDHDFICTEDLPEKVRESNLCSIDESLHNLSYQDAKEKYLAKFSKQYIKNLLIQNKGNISKVARIAGISRATIYRILNR